MTKQTIKEQILHFMESQKRKSFSMEEIAQGLNLEKVQIFKILVQTIAQMERESQLVSTKRQSPVTNERLINRRNVSCK